MSRKLEARVEQLERRGGAALGCSRPKIIWLASLEPLEPSALANDFEGVSINAAFHPLPAGEDIDAFEARLMAQAEREVASESGLIPICTVDVR